MTVTESDLREIENKASLLLGQKAWGAELGVGSFVTIEFGSRRPATEASERPHGEWHLWVYCCAWRLETEDEVVAASEDPRQKLQAAVQRLNNRVLQAVKVERPALETTFTFDDELTLRLFPIFSKDFEHWMLYDPNGFVLTVGPGTEWSYEAASG
jgi:hypothetical protein